MPEQTPAVYIDPLMNCLVSRQWKWSQSCHMFIVLGTPLEVLHDFAKRIGLRREWFQDGKVPHYDLNPRRREMAIKAGAVELERRPAVQIMREWKMLHGFEQSRKAVPNA